MGRKKWEMTGGDTPVVSCCEAAFTKGEKMRSKILKRKSAGWLLLFFLLILCLFQYGIQRIYGFSMFPDEFGYWAPAAAAMGWDWSEISALGSYYSFGYGFVLLPVLMLTDNSIASYRAATGINIVLMCAGLVILCHLLQKLFPDEEKEKTAIISGIAVLYPAWIFYAQMTLAEALLFFLYVFVCWLFVLFLEKPRVITAMGLLAALSYMYFVHMRSIGTLTAAILTLLLLLAAERESGYAKRSLLILSGVVIFLLLGHGMKQNVLQTLYAGSGEVFYNDYGGQWDKLNYIMSLPGITDFALGCIGKLLYLALSTYGLAVWGIYFVIRKVFIMFRSLGRQKRSAADFFWLFVLLSVLGQFLITCIYTIGNNHGGNGRLDLFVHGRYNEVFFSLLMALGVMAMLNSRKLWRGTGIILSGTALMTLIVGMTAHEEGLQNVHGYFMVGMSYMLKEDGLLPAAYFAQAWVFGAVLIMLTAACVMAVKKRGGWNVVLLSIALLQAGLGIHAGEHYIYRENSYGYGDIQTADKLSEILEKEGKEKKILYVFSGGTPYIEQVQFRLRGRKIDVTAESNRQEIEAAVMNRDILITSEDWSYNRELEKIYENFWISGHLCLYYD